MGRSSLEIAKRGKKGKRKMYIERGIKKGIERVIGRGVEIVIKRG